MTLRPAQSSSDSGLRLFGYIALTVSRGRRYRTRTVVTVAVTP